MQLRGIASLTCKYVRVWGTSDVIDTHFPETSKLTQALGNVLEEGGAQETSDKRGRTVRGRDTTYERYRQHTMDLPTHQRKTKKSKA